MDKSSKLIIGVGGLAVALSTGLATYSILKKGNPRDFEGTVVNERYEQKRYVFDIQNNNSERTTFRVIENGRNSSGTFFGGDFYEGDGPILDKRINLGDVVKVTVFPNLSKNEDGSYTINLENFVSLSHK